MATFSKEQRSHNKWYSHILWRGPQYWFGGVIDNNRLQPELLGVASNNTFTILEIP